MAKGIIVVDVPECCMECRSCYHADDLELCGLVKRLYRCRFEPEDIEDVYLPDIMRAKPDWCPIRQLPEKKMCSMSICIATEEYHERKGWNACIDEILKEVRR